MALHQNHPNGDSPCDDRLYHEKTCCHCDDTEKFYEKKLEEIRICITPVIYFLNAIKIPPSVRLAKKMLLEFCDYPGWEQKMLEFDEEAFVKAREENDAV